MLEVLIASAIFAGITTVLGLLLEQNQRASAKVAGQSDVTAESMVLFEKVRGELIHARLLGVSQNLQSVSYWVPRSQSGLPVLLANGDQDWLPGEPAQPDVATLTFSPGAGLSRDFQGRTQIFAKCSKDTVLSFGYSAGSRLLQFYGYVGTRDSSATEKNNYRPFYFQLHLTNVQ